MGEKDYRIRQITSYGQSIKKVRGEAVTIEGFEDMDFFIHQPVEGWRSSFKYHISEARTGFTFARGNTKEEARIDAERVLQGQGRKATEEAIARGVENYGSLLDGAEHKETP